jgi:hypothetical protein
VLLWLQHLQLVQFYQFYLVGKKYGFIRIRSPPVCFSPPWV